MLRRAPIGQILVAIGLMGVAAAVDATPICRWVDEQGRTHISETVPDQYKHSATCTDSQRYELSPKQRQEAEQRAAQEKARAEQQRSSGSPAAAPPSTQPDGVGLQLPAKRPAQTVTEDTDCETWWRLYDESVECFGPYRTVHGATKAEAFDHCNVIPSPVPKCGARRTSPWD